VHEFGWISFRRPVPPEWDLRDAGWLLAASSRIGRDPAPAACLVDGEEGLRLWRQFDPAEIWPRAGLMLLAIERGERRRELLAQGFGEVLGHGADLGELDLRARRLAQDRDRLVRSRDLGPVVLDLFHRDARRGARWLHLHPREFELLWRLADAPGERVTREQLFRDVWRLSHVPETNSLEVHVSRLRAKLALAGLEGLVVTDPAGGYRLARGEAPGQPATGGTRALDSHARMFELAKRTAKRQKE